MSGSAELTAWPIVALLMVTVTWLRLNRTLFDDVLSPFAVLLFAWVGPLMLQAANLSGYETAWTFGSSALVACATLVLVSACLFPWLAANRRPHSEEPRPAFARLLALFRRPGLLTVLLAAYAVAFGVYVYSEFVTNPGGVPLLNLLRGRLTPVADIHRWGKDTRWTAISSLLYVLVPMAYLAFKANKGRPVLRTAAFTLALLFPVMGILKLSRSDVFAATISIFAVEHYARMFGSARARDRRRDLARAAVVGACALVVYYAMMGVRIGSTPFPVIYAELIEFRVDRNVPLRGMMGAVYGYTAMPFENLHRFLDEADGRVHAGAGTLRPFVSAAGLGELADRAGAEVGYPAPATGAAGSATILSSVVAAARVGGGRLVVGGKGGLIWVLYARLRREPSMLNLFLYINFLGSWIWLFFNNAFGILSLYLNAAFVLVVAVAAEESLT
jgi:hypothetical protein